MCIIVRILRNDERNAVKRIKTRAGLSNAMITDYDHSAAVTRQSVITTTAQQSHESVIWYTCRKFTMSGLWHIKNNNRTFFVTVITDYDFLLNFCLRSNS